MRPFESQLSEKFLKKCRDGDVDDVQLLLETNRNLVNDFDDLGQTGLHLAVKRGHLELVSLLIQYSADPNAEDIVNLIIAASYL